jgi:hypothetical protein
MIRYRKHVRAMGPDEFFKEMHDVNNEYCKSAKMHFLIKHLTKGWRNHMKKTKKRVGVTKQHLPLKKIMEKIVESQNAKNIDEGCLVLVNPIECEVGVTKQHLPPKKIMEKIVESQNAKNIDEGCLVLVNPIECDFSESTGPGGQNSDGFSSA